LSRKPANTASTTVKDATFGLLRAFGIKKVFGNPGSTELPFLSDWPDDIDYVLGLQEASVLGMADGYAQATRNAGFVNLHSAAGVGNALGNIFNAYRNQTPMVISAGQQARSIMPLQPFLFSERATEFPQPYVKYSIEPARAEDVRPRSRAPTCRDAASLRADLRLGADRRLDPADAAGRGA
jgi:benzoylformate decarboxylase